MTIPYGERSVVAIDPTPRGIAFVFFENGELLDRGTRSAEIEEEEELRIVDHLIDGCAADVLILEDPDVLTCRRKPRVRQLLRDIAASARKRRVLVITVGREEVRASWRGRGVGTKEAMAAAIAERFPDLLPVVPPLRKTGHNEDARVNIFDAASLALYAFDHLSDPVR